MLDKKKEAFLEKNFSNIYVITETAMVLALAFLISFIGREFYGSI